MLCSDDGNEFEPRKSVTTFYCCECKCHFDVEVVDEDNMPLHHREIDDSEDCVGELFSCNEGKVFAWMNAYEHDRKYGGPEEGGWWYSTWEPIASVMVHAEYIRPDYNDDGRTSLSTDPEAFLEFQKLLKNIHGKSIMVNLEREMAESGPTRRPSYH